MPIAVKRKWHCPFSMYISLIAIAAIFLQVASKKDFAFHPAFTSILLSLAQNSEYVTDSWTCCS